MATHTENKSLTVRLWPSLYEASAQTARKRGRSLNDLVQQGLEEIVRKQQEELSAGFELLAQHPEERDVEYAFAAQAEVVLRDRT